jgi:chromosomal replication initiation ATPase DnaA|tara:strand:+ start:1918 stop:2271 length:354 start_codon:yes stop_codon:yes gene_type:complete
MDNEAFEIEVRAMRDLETKYPFKVADMLTAVRKYENIEPTALFSLGRRASMVMWRWRIFYLAYHDLGMSLTQVGRLMKRDHSTVLHGLRKYDADADIVELDRIRFLAKLCAKDRQCA